MRAIFDHFHPPINLVDRLAAPDTHKTLRRLKVQGALTPEQWALLYPNIKRRVTSQSFDAHLLVTLVKYICRLTPPYPNGWEGEPVEADDSLAADLVRFLDYIDSTAQSERVSDEHLPAHLQNVTNLLLRIVGRDVKAQRQIDVIRCATLTSDAQRQYIDAVRKWAKQVREQRAHERNMALNDARRQNEHELTKLQASIEGRRRRRQKTAPASLTSRMTSQDSKPRNVVAMSGATSALSRMKSVSDDKPRTGQLLCYAHSFSCKNLVYFQSW